MWRERIEEISKVSFWDEMQRSRANRNGYRETWKLACRSLIHIGSTSLNSGYTHLGKKKLKDGERRSVAEDWKGIIDINANARLASLRQADEEQPATHEPLNGTITSWTAAKRFVSTYLRDAKDISKHICSFVGSFDDASVLKNDVMFLFVHYIGEEVEVADAIQPAEEALFEELRGGVDAHFSYVANESETMHLQKDESDDGMGEIMMIILILWRITMTNMDYCCKMPILRDENTALYTPNFKWPL